MECVFCVYNWNEGEKEVDFTATTSLVMTDVCNDDRWLLISERIPYQKPISFARKEKKKGKMRER